MIVRTIFASIIFFLTSSCNASLIIPMAYVNANGTGKSIGTIRADDTLYGLLLIPHLHGLTPGTHGFHIHELPLCSNFGKAAGGHWDPERTNSHRGPYRGNGHLGDLPVLIVNADGTATLPVLAPRLKLSQIKDHALMIHAGSDNYSDKPPMGGGGARVACGIVPFF